MHAQKLLVIIAALALCTACQKSPDTKVDDSCAKIVHVDEHAQNSQDAMHDQAKPNDQNAVDTVAPATAIDGVKPVFLVQKTFQGDVLVNYASRIPFNDNGPSLETCVKALESTLILFYEGKRTDAPWIVIAEKIARVDERDAYLFSIGQGTIDEPKIYFGGAVSMDSRVYSDEGDGKMMFYADILDDK